MLKSRLLRTVALSAVVVVLGANGAGASGTTKTFAIRATGVGIGGGLGLHTSGYAKGTISVNRVTDEVCYRITDRGLGRVEAAHIHVGKAGVDGSVVVTLNVKAFNSKHPACVKASAPVVRTIFKSPALFYFNVHTAAFPNGAVRAQL